MQPFRMSGFAIYGTPIIVGMLVPNPTLTAIIFWQGINQTHNAFINYNNRNASQPTPVKKILTGYVGAVAASVSIAVGLQQTIKRVAVSDATRMMLFRFVPYPAVAVARLSGILSRLVVIFASPF